jgi:hypothetical protein
MTITGSGARLTSFCEALPSNTPAMRPGAATADDDRIGLFIARDLKGRTVRVAVSQNVTRFLILKNREER